MVFCNTSRDNRLHVDSVINFPIAVHLNSAIDWGLWDQVIYRLAFAFHQLTLKFFVGGEMQLFRNISMILFRWGLCWLVSCGDRNDPLENRPASVRRLWDNIAGVGWRCWCHALLFSRRCKSHKFVSLLIKSLKLEREGREITFHTRMWEILSSLHTCDLTVTYVSNKCLKLVGFPRARPSWPLRRWTFPCRFHSLDVHFRRFSSRSASRLPTGSLLVHNAQCSEMALPWRVRVARASWSSDSQSLR